MGEASRDHLKHIAAEAAVAEVEDGTIVGLGTGSTAAMAVDALGARVADGLRIQAISTSERTARQAERVGIPLTDFTQHPRIDLTIDGADEVEIGTLAMIKGLGGALLREKIVAAASRRMIVIVDEAKLVSRLGTRAPVPVEIVAFGAPATLQHLADIGVAPGLRMVGAEPYRTDGGNLIADCACGPITDPHGLEARLVRVVGVVETGLFLNLASRIVIGTATGVRYRDHSAD